MTAQNLSNRLATAGIKLKYPRFKYSIFGDTTEIYITRRDGSKHTVLIDTKNLQKLDGWSVSVKVHGKTFCARISKGYLNEHLLHRFLYKEKTDLYIDHKNSNGLDCREHNLRACTNSQNQSNRRSAASNNHVGILGVSLDKSGKWRADCRVDKKSNYLGLFSSVEEAEAAVKAFRAVHVPFSKEASGGNTTA